MATPLKKTCFVTIGATASFDGLIRSVVSPNFCTALKSLGYTELLVQYGKDGAALFDTCMQGVQNPPELAVVGFDLDTNGLGQYMKRAKGSSAQSSDPALTEGVVISHAGSGTILEALRIAIPLIVVPNVELLDNHQVELAEALATQGYVVHGRLDSLEEALTEAEALRAAQRAWPPPNSGVHRQAKGLRGIVDEEMGFLD